MIKTIKKGGHYSSPLSFKLHTGRKSFSTVVKFDESCRYDLGNDNQLDWNKLGGLSYGYHKHNSVRIAWRYNKAVDKIELALYCYIDGERHISKFHELFPINEKIYVIASAISTEIHSIAVINDEYCFADIQRVIKPKWGYYLNPYFGGNEVAPHDINIWLQRV
jgi:hypothetical protein